MRIRPEAAADHAAVRALLDDAFGGPAESVLVERLRAGGEGRIILVAKAAGGSAGHVMLSQMRAPFPSLGLAPLAVAAGCRRQGIGSARVAAARDRAHRWRRLARDLRARRSDLLESVWKVDG